jgi:hypothetical protein
MTTKEYYFYYYIDKLLETFGNNSSSVVGLGFVDGTSLLEWGPTGSGQLPATSRGVSRERGAARHGGKFARENFTRRRHADIQAAARIEGFDGKPVESLRVLGVDHVQEAARKGEAQFEAWWALPGALAVFDRR